MKATASAPEPSAHVCTAGAIPASSPASYLENLPAWDQVPRIDTRLQQALTDSHRLRRILQWCAEDLHDPAIRDTPATLAFYRAAVIKRLEPHLDEVVALAWAHLQSSSDSKEAP